MTDLIAILWAVACILLGWAACAILRGGWREIKSAWMHTFKRGPYDGASLGDGPFYLWLAIRLAGVITLVTFAVLAGYNAVIVLYPQMGPTP